MYKTSQEVVGIVPGGKWSRLVKSSGDGEGTIGGLMGRQDGKR